MRCQQCHAGEQCQDGDESPQMHGDTEAPDQHAMTRYCGMASSHHLMSTRPRDRCSGYGTSSVAG